MILLVSTIEEQEMHTPIVIEQDNGREKFYDIFSRMLKDRIIFINGVMDEGSGAIISSQLLFLDSTSSDDIYIYINSPGGHVYEAMAIYDTMQYVKSEITTVVIGIGASAGSLLAQAGAKNKRYIMEHARMMIHQPWAGIQGQVSDLKLAVRENEILKAQLIDIYRIHNSKNKTAEEIEKAIDRDNYMSAQEAIDFGLCDKIVSKKAKKIIK
jgi:ATP-dependent Clp protease protease subunit